VAVLVEPGSSAGCEVGGLDDEALGALARRQVHDLADDGIVSMGAQRGPGQGEQDSAS